MLSKLPAWDFVQKYPKTIDPSKPGLYAFLIDDPYLERVILDRLPKKELNLSLYTGSEFTRDFIEEHFLNLSFFGGSESILILNAENIPPASLLMLIESEIDCSERFLLLFFSKSSKPYQSFIKSKLVNAIEVELPRFWEGARLWQFCLRVKEINLPAPVTSFALSNLEHNFESFFWLIDTIKINFPEGNVDILAIQDLVTKERWDFFELVDLFHRSRKIFFEEILKKETDYEWLRALAAFMQSHMTKILFPEEIKAKAKLSKYDQSIVEMSAKMSRDEAKYYLEFFSNLEISAKSKDVFLINQIRLETLK